MKHITNKNTLVQAQTNTPNLNNSWLKTDSGGLARVKGGMVIEHWRVILDQEL
jgi:hypothetical protein